MTDAYDALETRDPAEREADLFSRLPEILSLAATAPERFEQSVAGADQLTLPAIALGTRRVQGRQCHAQTERRGHGGRELGMLRAQDRGVHASAGLELREAARHVLGEQVLGGRVVERFLHGVVTHG